MDIFRTHNNILVTILDAASFNGTFFAPFNLFAMFYIIMFHPAYIYILTAFLIVAYLIAAFLVITVGVRGFNIFTT